MEKKFNESKFGAFFKKNGYLILMVICLLAIAAMITYAIVNTNNNANGALEKEQDSATPVVNSDDNNSEETPQDHNGEPTPTDKEVISKAVVISAPMDNATVLKGYTDSELVYNATMKHWATHQAIDYKAEVGDKVKAVFDGEVIQVTTTTLKGTTIVIKHDDGFESSYSLLDSNVLVKVGDKVKAGTVLDTIGDTGVFETADGTHLHFELRKDGELVDPELYTDSGNK